MDSISVISIGLGAFVGVMMALTGAGGGILSVPLLVFGLKLSVASAGPIGLLAIAVAGSLGLSMACALNNCAIALSLSWQCLASYWHPSVYTLLSAFPISR